MQRPDPVDVNDPERWPPTYRGQGTLTLHSSPAGPDGSLALAPAPRVSQWFVRIWTGALLLAGCASTAFATVALWQLGAVVNGMVELGGSTSVTSTSPPPPGARSASTPRAPPSSVGGEERGITPAASPTPLDEDPFHASLATSQAFEAAAEASERIVPLAAEPAPSYEQTECGDVFVYIVSIAEGAPTASAASLAIGKGSPARFRRPGQRIGDWEVLAITDDWSGANPGVWLLKGNTVCRAELAGNPTRVHSPLKQKQKPPVKRRRRRARR